MSEYPTHYQPEGAGPPAFDVGTGAPKPSLGQLLRRKDVWRGHSQSFVEQAHWATGHRALDQALVAGGWPLSTLVEICQTAHSHAEWLLMGPVIRHACAQGGYVILLNPPAQPYVPGLVQQKINLDQLILVQTPSKADFVASFGEILRAPICQLLLSWEPAQPLNYAELRKCQLATGSHAGLSLLFRNERQQHQSSPASLRLSVRPDLHHLELQVFKQRGKRHNAPVRIALPDNWQPLPQHSQLGQPQQPAKPQPTAQVFTFGKRQADTP